LPEICVYPARTAVTSLTTSMLVAIYKYGSRSVIVSSVPATLNALD
jgi:hypothetical protein